MTEEVEHRAFDPETATALQVCRWLRAAMLAYEAEKSRWAFEPLALRMGHRDDVAHDLFDVYETLTNQAKERWRRGVVALVSDAGIMAKSDVAVTVVDFAVLIGASEILKALSDVVVASGRSPSRRVLDRIIDAVFELTGEPGDAIACLYAASKSEEFAPESAGLVLMALCRFEPDRWLEHAKHLTPAMEALKDRLEPKSTALRHYASNVVSGVTLDQMARDWQAFVGDGKLQWLKEDVVGGDEPLVLEHDGTLSLAENPEVRVKIPATGYEELAHLVLRGIQNEHNLARSLVFGTPTVADEPMLESSGWFVGGESGASTANTMAPWSEVVQYMRRRFEVIDRDIPNVASLDWADETHLSWGEFWLAEEVAGRSDTGWTPELNELVGKNDAKRWSSFVPSGAGEELLKHSGELQIASVSVVRLEDREMDWGDGSRYQTFLKA